MIFTQPAFLWGLLAVGIPLVIHLINLRRYRKVYFSNVQRLSMLHTEHRRHDELRRWLVLAMRMLAVAGLVLAFAQPVLPSSDGHPSQGDKAVTLYVDNSFSMAQAGSDGSLLDAARQKGREVVEAYPAGTRFRLLTGERTGSDGRWLGRDEILTALDEVQPSPAAPLMSSRIPQSLPKKGKEEVYLISDFQRTTADLYDLPSDSMRGYTLVPLSGLRQDNVWIDTVVLDAPAFFAGGAVEVVVTLRNGGHHDAEQVPVRLELDGQERAVATVDVAAGATERVTLGFTIEQTDWTEGCVRVEDYPITFDDNYWFALKVRERVQVLEIDGRRPNESLRRLFADDATVDYLSAPRLQHDLEHCDLVVLDEVHTLASGEAAQLAEWVTEGGSLLVVPSEREVGAGLDALLQQLGAPRLGRWVEREVRATSVDVDHRLYQGVFSNRSDEMEMPTVRGHYTLEGYATVRQDVITLSDGGVMLTVTPVGKGYLYLFTTPLVAEWTDLVGQALFVPTLYNMALYGRPVPPAAYELGRHEPIVLQEETEVGERPQELSDGLGLSLLPDVRKVAGRRQLLLHGELSHDGIYRLGDERLAFNYPRRESSMDFLDRSEIAKAIADRQDCRMVRSANKPLTDELKAREGGRGLWRWCVVVALVALLTETLLLLSKKNEEKHKA